MYLLLKLRGRRWASYSVRAIMPKGDCSTFTINAQKHAFEAKY